MSETETLPAATDTPAALEPLHSIFLNELVRQIAASLSPLISDKEWKPGIEAAVNMLENINPRTATEGMLAVQIIVSHHMALKCSLKGADFHYNSQLYLNQGNKFMRSFAMLAETLHHLRDTAISRQEITVQHVHINDGGQAIVGNVSAQGGEENEKKWETPCTLRQSALIPPAAAMPGRAVVHPANVLP